jgi:hypothetical protein
MITICGSRSSESEPVVPQTAIMTPTGPTRRPASRQGCPRSTRVPPYRSECSTTDPRQDPSSQIEPHRRPHPRRTPYVANRRIRDQGTPWRIGSLRGGTTNRPDRNSVNCCSVEPPRSFKIVGEVGAACPSPHPGLRCDAHFVPPVAVGFVVSAPVADHGATGLVNPGYA